MLIVPWIVGCGIAGRVTARAALVLVVLLALYLAHHHAMAWWRLRRSLRSDASARRRASVTCVLLGLVGIVAAGPLWLAERVSGFLVLAAPGAASALAAFVLIRRREERSLPGQALAAIGLTLSAPAAWYAITGDLGRVAAALWLLNAAYFLGAVWHVRMLIAARRRKMPLASLRRRLGFAVPTIAVEVILLAVAAASLRLGGLSSPALFGFAPLSLQLIVDIVRLDRPPPLKRVGLLATVSSILFAVLVIKLA